MNAAGIANISSGVSQNSKTSKMQSDLDRNAFFKLLITQLKNQSPMEPMKNREFISQMASFTSLEQMRQMNENMNQFLKMKNLSEGASLIGKTIEKKVEEDNGEQSIIKGEVEKIVFEEEETYALLAKDKGKINLDEIDKIYQS